MPKAHRTGTVPAVEYARASLARKIIARRTEAGLNQRQFAKLAGIASDQLNRIERGKGTPTLGTIESIDRGLRVARGAGKGRSR